MSISLRGLSSMATRAVLAELSEAWRQTGGEVRFESVGGVDAAKRVQAGEAFDVVVLASDAIQKLAATGAVLPDTRTDLLRSSVAIAVRAGAPKPDTTTEAALRDTVLGARSVGYSTGPSGAGVRRMFERWGILDTLQKRLVQAPPGTPVGHLVADGRVELGFQQQCELMQLDGVEVLGPMPPGLEIVTTFSAAECATSTQHEPVRALLDFLRGPDADEAKRRHGLTAA